MSTEQRMVATANGEGSMRAEQNKEYLQQFLEKLEKSPKDLRDTEKKLGEKYLAAQSAANKMMAKSREVQEQMAALESQLRQLHDQTTAELGKAGGILEALLALKED